MGTEVNSGAATTATFKPGDKVQFKSQPSGEVMTVHGVTSDGRLSVFSSMYSTETLHDAELFVEWPNPWSQIVNWEEPQEEPKGVVYETPPNPPQPNFLDQLIAKAEEALKVQTGGNHYLKGTIQPIEFFHDNGIPFAEASAMKYLYRWRDKGGKQDLQKVIQICLQLIAMEDRKAVRQEAR